MAQMSSRRSAAEQILKGMGGGKELPPIEDDELAPVEEEGGMPPEAGAPPMPEEMGGEMPPPPMPEEEAGMDLDSAMAGMESVLAGLPEDAAKEARTHMEAIRDIVSSAGAGPKPPEDAETPAGPELSGGLPPEAPDAGMEKLPL